MEFKTSVWSCKIDGLSHWIPGGVGWRKYIQGGITDLHLRLYHDILLITNYDKALESLNVVSMKIKGFLKGNHLILAISDKDKAIRKIKFHLMCAPEAVRERAGQLAALFPIEDRNTKKFLNKTQHKYRTVDETLRGIMERGNNDVIPQMPALYQDFVKLCILDPSFPQLVNETEKIVNSFLP